MKKNYQKPSMQIDERLDVFCLTTSSENGVVDFPIDWIGDTF